MVVALVTLAGCMSGTGAGDAPGAGPGEVLALSDAGHGERFEPAQRSIAVGDTLTFRVAGATPHTVDFGPDTSAAVDGVSAAHSGPLASGDTHAVTFTRPGTYDYFCQYHLPGMVGRVTVA